MTELATELYEFTTCSICFYQLNSPRMLPCQHTFCVKCLDGHIRASADRGSAQSTFSCPLCNTNLPVPKSGAADFPLNRMIVNVQEAVARKNPETDQKMCELCTENVAEKICIECNKSICHQCIKIHDQLPNNNNHSIYLTSELNAMSIEQICRFSSEFCKSHQNEKVQFYCERCDDVICIKCRLTTHHTAEHVCTDLCDKNAEWKAELDKCEQEFNSMEDNISSEMERLNRMKNEESSREEISLLKLLERKDKLICEITEYYSMLEVSLCSISDEDNAHIDKERENLQQKIDLVRHMKKASSFAQRFSSNSDLLKRMKILTDRMNDYKQNMMSFESISLQKQEFVAGESEDSKIQTFFGYLVRERILPQTRPTDIALCSSAGYVIGSRQGDVVLYNEYHHTTVSLPRPGKTTSWNPVFVTTTGQTIIVSNYVCMKDGGALIEYTHSGQYRRTLLIYDNPRGVTVSGDKLIAVSGNDTEGWVRFYNEHQGSLRMVKEHRSTDLADPRCVKMNDVTGDTVISHKGGVTALHADSFSQRWLYKCRDTQPGLLTVPCGVAVTTTGDVLVADRDSGRVLLLSKDGEYRGDFRMAGEGGWELQGVCVNKDGMVTVVDYKSSKLYIFKLDK